jgi:hypothetical protein
VVVSFGGLEATNLDEQQETDAAPLRPRYDSIDLDEELGSAPPEAADPPASMKPTISELPSPLSSRGSSVPLLEQTRQLRRLVLASILVTLTLAVAVVLLLYKEPSPERAERMPKPATKAAVAAPKPAVAGPADSLATPASATLVTADAEAISAAAASSAPPVDSAAPLASTSATAPPRPAARAPRRAPVRKKKGRYELGF